MSDDHFHNSFHNSTLSNLDTLHDSFSRDMHDQMQRDTDAQFLSDIHRSNADHFDRLKAMSFHDPFKDFDAAHHIASQKLPGTDENDDWPQGPLPNYCSGYNMFWGAVILVVLIIGFSGGF